MRKTSRDKAEEEHRELNHEGPFGLYPMSNGNNFRQGSETLLTFVKAHSGVLCVACMLSEAGQQEGRPVSQH